MTSTLILWCIRSTVTCSLNSRFIRRAFSPKWIWKAKWWDFIIRYIRIRRTVFCLSRYRSTYPGNIKPLNKGVYNITVYDTVLYVTVYASRWHYYSEKMGSDTNGDLRIPAYIINVSGCYILTYYLCNIGEVIKPTFMAGTHQNLIPDVASRYLYCIS